MKTVLAVVILFLMAFVSCVSKSGISPEMRTQYRAKGMEITSRSQAVLLTNVSSAMEKGGTEFAVEFCHLEALALVDSLSQVFYCRISRVSDKNRNPENSLNKTEARLWKAFQTGAQTDTLLRLNNKITYYKRINTAMPTCLKCHGDTDGEIGKATLDKIQRLYPNDRATGYKLNDFRGLWKIEFAK